MVVHVYPDPAVEPLVVGPGAPGTLADVVPLFGDVVDGVATTVIRVAVPNVAYLVPVGSDLRVELVAEDVLTEIASVDGVDPTPVAHGRAWATDGRRGTR